MKNLTAAQRKQVKERLIDNFHPTFHKDGTVTVRNSYFYSHAKGVANLEARTLNALQELGFTVNVQDSGNQWAPFCGGSDVNKGQGSFYWVRLNNFNAIPVTQSETV